MKEDKKFILVVLTQASQSLEEKGKIQSKPANEKFRENWDNIFGKKNQEVGQC